MKPTLPVRRLYDKSAPNYAKITTPDGIVGIALTGDEAGDLTVTAIAAVADGYGMYGLRPAVFVKKTGA